MSLVMPSDPISDRSFSFNSFELITVQFVERLTSKLSSKTSSLDPMPTKLIKSCSQQIAPAISCIINSSLGSGKFPESCKSAIVKPLLKKQGLVHNVLRNDRLVSNLPFISKANEKIVLFQINQYFCQNNLYAKCQSAYRGGTARKLLSCECAMMECVLLMCRMMLFLLYLICLLLLTPSTMTSYYIDCFGDLESEVLFFSG